jgi:hypothetical protein
VFIDVFVSLLFNPKDGIPTLRTLAQLPLPPPAVPHPGLSGQAREYDAARDEYHYNYIVQKVATLSSSPLAKIMTLKDWQDKQDAVDELFETVESDLKEQEQVLGLHPKFGYWVETALEEHLQNVLLQQQQQQQPKAADLGAGEEGSASKEGSAVATTEPIKDEAQQAANPVFMDCYNPEEPDEMVPSILNPLKPHPNDGPGRMVEEWELSAHSATKRILIRQPTRFIAKTLVENEVSRIYVHGRKGVGKVRSLLPLECRALCS